MALFLSFPWLSNTPWHQYTTSSLPTQPLTHIYVVPVPWLGFPGDSVVKNLPAMREIPVQSLGQEDPLEKAMANHTSVLAWGIPWTDWQKSIGSQSWTEVKVKVTQSCPTLLPHGLYSPWNSPGQTTSVARHSLLQGIFPTQGSNPGLLNCRQILDQWATMPPPVHCSPYLDLFTYLYYLPSFQI